MEIVRYSAVKNFGIPIDNPADMFDRDKMLSLMRAYDVNPEPIPEILVDITPYYWQKNKFYYFLSRKDVDSPAVVEILPKELGSTTYLLGALAAGVTFAVETNKRSFEIPTQQEAFAVTGPGPRFDGQVCIHELILEP